MATGIIQFAGIIRFEKLRADINFQSTSLYSMKINAISRVSQFIITRVMWRAGLKKQCTIDSCNMPKPGPHLHLPTVPGALLPVKSQGDVFLCRHSIGSSSRHPEGPWGILRDPNLSMPGRGAPYTKQGTDARVHSILGCLPTAPLPLDSFPGTPPSFS